MTTPAKMALEYFVGQQRAWSGTDKAAFYDTAVAALRVLDEVQSGRSKNLPHSLEDEAMYSNCYLANENARGFNDCLNHLKQIAGE